MQKFYNSTTHQNNEIKPSLRTIEFLLSYSKSYHVAHRKSNGFIEFNKN